MNPIKEFFKKKKADSKFKSAGPGHKLSESPSSSSKKSSGLLSSFTGHSSHSQEHHLSDEAKRAGAAALARIEQKQQPPVNWSLQATKAQARKELELENTLKLKQATITTTKEVIQDSCPTLAVSGVYFTCPIIGPEILPRDEIKIKIREFLYNELEQERGLTACLMIHTLNKNKDMVHAGVETLARYLTNIIDDPTEEKYRKIRIKNRVFQEKIVGLEGAFDFLIACGFSRQTLKTNDEEEEYFVFPEENLDDLDNVQSLKEALLGAEPIIPILDRNLRVLKPSYASEKVNLPDAFFNLSTDEIKKEHEAKAETVEMLTQLRTKAMRERDEKKELHIYKYTLIRIRFPDGIILQGTFYVYEKLSAVKEFISENLIQENREFSLLLPAGAKLTDDNQSLLELKLVPAVILNFHWLSDNESKENSGYLKHEVMSLLADL